MEYKCERCGYSAEFQYTLKKHLLKKNICEPTLKDVDVSCLYKNIVDSQNKINETKSHQCERCKKYFSSKQGKSNHKKICKIISVKPDECVDLRVVIADQQKQIEELKSNAKTVITNQTNIGTQNIQNITINAFGKEDTSYLALLPEYKKFMVSCLKDTVPGILKLIDAIYYHKDHPENHNIKKHNKKDKYTKVFDGSTWNMTLSNDSANMVSDTLNHEFMIFLESMDDNNTRVKDTTMKTFMESVGNALEYDFSMFDYCYESNIKLGRRKRELFGLILHHINYRTNEIK
jgi:hypothetical protein